MPLLDINLNPTSRQLSQFGVIALVALPLIGWIWSAGTITILVLAAIGLTLAVLGFVAPRSISPVFVVIMLVAAPIGIVVGEISIAIIYYLLFVPLGLFFRVRRKDPLLREIDKNQNTYWQPIEEVTDVSSYFRQS